MKKTTILFLSVSLAFILLFASCKKSSPSVTPDDTINAIDGIAVGNAINGISSDAGIAADQVSQITRALNPYHICGAIVDTGTGNSISITYDSSYTCSNLKRSGNVSVTLLSTNGWRQAGGQILVSFNVSAIDALNGFQYSFSGKDTITNETGGLAADVLYNNNPGPVSRRHTGNMKITFPNGSTRTWSIDRTTGWANSGNVVTASLYSEAAGNVHASGTDRYGENFTASFTNNGVPDSIYSNNHTCNGIAYWLAYSGISARTTGTRVATTGYGDNASGTNIGTPTSCPGGAYGIYISYLNATSGVSGNYFIAY